MAAKTNTSASEIDKTSFWWAGLCGICHPGGGPSEFDRDGELYYDMATGQFGYEKLGKVAGDVTLDGDYAEVSNKTGALRAAPWDMTGVAEADCLSCHRADRAVNEGTSLNWVWRSATLRAKDALVDSGDNPVKAYAAAATAGQGWFTGFEMKTVPAGKPPLAASVDLDYQPGVDNSSLVVKNGDLYVSAGAIVGSPKDYACWGCHVTADTKKRGREWFDPSSDVHYAAFNNLDDLDNGNDIEAGDSAACVQCHPAGMSGIDLNHNFGKGNAPLGSVRNDTDFVGFRTCRECHLASSAVRDPNAPAPPSNTLHSSDHLNTFSCEACHIPYKEVPAGHVVDNAVTGSSVNYKTDVWQSADPLNPDDADRSRWYPSFIMKQDVDGRSRVFPVKLLLSMWWGDWDKNGTPNDYTDDVVKPIPLWRVRAVLGGIAKPADNKLYDLDDIKRYLDAMAQADDVHGNDVAAIPVLVKGGKIWFDNGAGGVATLDYQDEHIHTESSHPFAVSHNVRTTGAIGTDCNDCHGNDNPFFDRKILIDPFDVDGNPVYKTVAELLGFRPPF